MDDELFQAKAETKKKPTFLRSMATERLSSMLELNEAAVEEILENKRRKEGEITTKNPILNCKNRSDKFQNIMNAIEFNNLRMGRSLYKRLFGIDIGSVEIEEYYENYECIRGYHEYQGNLCLNAMQMKQLLRVCLQKLAHGVNKVFSAIFELNIINLFCNIY